ncbi:hypothetical protein BX604_3209 [Burkholderia sp. JKS000303]|nr:hypothetical protein BX604_3209 [Burkholderia sp. JKS000303]
MTVDGTRTGPTGSLSSAYCTRGTGSAGIHGLMGNDGRRAGYRKRAGCACRRDTTAGGGKREGQVSTTMPPGNRVMRAPYA